LSLIVDLPNPIFKLRGFIVNVISNHCSLLFPRVVPFPQYLTVLDDFIPYLLDLRRIWREVLSRGTSSTETCRVQIPFRLDPGFLTLMDIADDMIKDLLWKLGEGSSPKSMTQPESSDCR
jgi:hypothetical protein